MTTMQKIKDIEDEEPPRTITSNYNCSNLDFGFGFNDINFSDRVLRLDIVEGDNTCTSLAKRLKKNDNESCHKGCGIKVKTIHISSIILAAKSPFFFKLFSNGMKESEEYRVTLRIDPSEEVALIDLLNFMYSNTLSSTTTSSLIDVLMVADKFQVSSCIRYCINLLCNLPMTCESALQCLHLPLSVIMADEVQPLRDAAKKYLAGYYEDFTKFEEEVIKLPLAEIEALLSSDDLQVTSEDVVYKFVLKWARKHYPVIEKRREILTTQLGSLIRFQNMTVRTLKRILTLSDFDPAYASKVVNEALLFKAESTHLHTFHASRTYKYRPVKVLESMFPHPNCIVYLDLKRKEFDHLEPNKDLLSEPFRLGGKWFYLSATHKTEPLDSFGLFLGMSSKQSGSCSVDYEFSARSKPTEEFVRKGDCTHTLNAGGECYGFLDLFEVSWNQFVASDSIYFINGVLYLKVEIAIRS